MKQITMPLLSPSMSEGQIVRWLKKEGEAIHEGEVIAEVETDKAIMDLEAFESGILKQILLPEGGRAPVNTPIALIEAESEETEQTAAAVSGQIKEEKEIPETQPFTKSSAEIKQNLGEEKPQRIRSSPLARKIAKEEQIELSEIQGTGPGGRIVKRDVLERLEQKKQLSTTIPKLTGPSLQPLTGAIKLPLSLMREKIAKRLLESKTTIPHFYLETEVSVTALSHFRNELNQYYSQQEPSWKFTYNDFILKATIEALKRVPSVNASWNGDSILRYNSINIAFAVAIEDGLITPVIKDGQNKSLMMLSKEAKELIQKAQERKLTPEEYTGGTITVSNLGMYGIENFYAIIDPPQVMILAIGAIIKKPIVDGQNNIVIGEVMRVSASCDHRVVDGATGAKFLKEFKQLMENPLSMLV
ncbi:pyruvate dehydrogenase complex dihydrolipoamide acetyltransferase [Methylacidiphilum caldifontis]|uniref:Acetyltransferase component of pyruvate dehydrogenase complex n=1 Tax=Methylacidiphilum caldifontis TaxID=2795386 RepID=A0A4Y8PCG4_9BACT|nr:pyruvate dehydrogenase complex dihydrolipoamide acetyltransferase [Methylacidiphilum caldifontis]QSR89029.1 pyruvate dehydrogenase complex dihydrolipoamide acetyltransferase [Methylacidiphilum caldifontis]TFE68624.1 pyruvate dehydrogenase complex dihydrolipoamide acetyltransferase [Methylacidiphilum caldifontis]